MGFNSPVPVALPAECKKAAKIFRSFVDTGNNGLDKVIPRNVLSTAAGFAIFTVVKAGFLFSARGGSGLVIARTEDGSWSAPSAIGLGGVGFGGQMGAEVTDFLIILNTKTAVRTFMAAGSMTLGGNLSVAVGPLGRNAEGSGSVSSKGKTTALYSYSKTKGLFGGISVEGSLIVERQDANRMAYGHDVSSKQLLTGALERPEWAQDLVDVLDACTGMPGGRAWVDDSASMRSGALTPDDYDDDRYDEHGMPVKQSSQEGRKRAGTLPRSSSYNNYAFGEGGGGGFSSSAMVTETKTGNRARSGSGSLRGIFKLDSTAPGVGNGIGFPRRKTGSPMQSPGISRKSSTLNPFASRSGASPGNPFDEPNSTHENEVDPFEAYASTLDAGPGNRPRSGSGISKDMDLSGEVLSPWNNDKGLPSPKPTYEHKNLPVPNELSTLSSGNRSRSSSLTAPAADEYGSPSLSRPGMGRSRASSTARFQSPLRDDFSPGDQQDQFDSNDLTSKFGRMRASSNATANKLSKRDTDGYPRNEFGEDGEDYYQAQAIPKKKKEEWTVDLSLPKSAGGGLFSKGRRSRANTGASDFHVDPMQWQQRGDEEDYRASTPKGDNDPYFNNVEKDEFTDNVKASRPKFETRPTFTVRKELLEAERDGMPRAIALFDFNAAESGDLGFVKGEIMIVTKQGKTKEEWWTGRNPTTGKEGIFPANFVELVKTPVNQ